MERKTYDKIVIAVCGGIFLGMGMGFLARKVVRAQEKQEVVPYKFADLPHGRIYKAVHEGCELFIVESDDSFPYNANQYHIATARGCH